MTLSASSVDHDIDFIFDSTPILLFFGVPAPGITQQPQSYETDMVEARFSSSFGGPVNFVAGAYYQKDDNDFEVRVPTTDGAGGLPPWDPLNANDFFAGGTTFFSRDRHDEIEQNALFGEVTFDIAERWELLVGARYFDVEQTSIQSTIHAFGGAQSPVAGEVIGQNINGNDIGRIRTSDDTTRPKVSLSFEASDDVLLYGLYSEGFRVGGVNNSNQPFAPGIPATFDSDELSNLEFGIKSRMLDDRVQLNAALFLIDWEDIQVEPRDPAGNIPFTTNGGAAEVNGLEWALTWLPNDDLTLNLTGTWLFDHGLTEDQPVLPGASPFVIVGQDGDDIPNVPDLQLFGSIRYEAELAGRPLALTEISWSIIGMLLTSTETLSFTKPMPYGLMRRPLTRISVRCAPRPRSETVLAPGPPCVTKPPNVLLICCEPDESGEPWTMSAVSFRPSSVVSSVVITWIGADDVNSFFFKREPVTTTRSTFFSSGFSSSAAGAGCACARSSPVPCRRPSGHRCRAPSELMPVAPHQRAQDAFADAAIGDANPVRRKHGENGVKDRAAGDD